MPCVFLSDIVLALLIQELPAYLERHVEAYAYHIYHFFPFIVSNNTYSIE